MLRCLCVKEEYLFIFSLEIIEISETSGIVSTLIFTANNVISKFFGQIGLGKQCRPRSDCS